ncbi:CDGSH iron-sulfur domain-containing protein [Specibacter sp. NPDC078692]|uniref:CDGSH iron-sulfur domain-containing protein n=1 Tax=Specibacter sp. NPDC078692 TaxID=3155818 RepID=UPI00342075D6
MPTASKEEPKVPGSTDQGHVHVRDTSVPEIVACPDGPLLVRGDFEIVSTTGEALPRRRKTVALCRCGASGIKPYCDGTHKLIGFRTGPETGQ